MSAYKVDPAYFQTTLRPMLCTRCCVVFDSVMLGAQAIGAQQSVMRATRRAVNHATGKTKKRRRRW